MVIDEAQTALFNLLRPTGNVKHQQFNIQQLYVLPTLYSYHFNDRDEKCLQRVTSWAFK
jgi:hypothetical protein